MRRWSHPSFLIVCQKETPPPAFLRLLISAPLRLFTGKKIPSTRPSCQRLNLRQLVGDSRKKNISLLSLPLLLIGNSPVFLKVICIINSSPVSKTEALTGKDLKKRQSSVSQTQQKSFSGRQSSRREWNIIWEMHIHTQSRTISQWPGHGPALEAFENPTGNIFHQEQIFLVGTLTPSTSPDFFFSSQSYSFHDTSTPTNPRP